MSRERNILIILSLMIFIFLMNTSFARVNFDDMFGLSGATDADLRVSTNSPFPFENVKVSLDNADFDLQRSYIKWILNGETISEGKGFDSASFTAGDLGETYNLTVTASDTNGKILRRAKVFTVSDLDVLYSADTYVPYFYKGNALPSPQSEISVAAIPHFLFNGKKINRENLLFKWYLNEEFEKEGWGKDSFSFKTGIFNGEDYEVKVKVSSEKKTFEQEKTIIIKTSRPEIYFYEYNNLDNIKYQKSISEFNLSAGEKISFIAEPFFTPKNSVNRIDYSWKVNGDKTEKSEPFNMMHFSSEAGNLGTADVNLKIEYSNLLDRIESGFRINVR